MPDRGRKFVFYPGEPGTATSRAEPPAKPQWVVRSPREYPPAGSIRFNRIAWVDFAAPGSVTPANLTFRGPKGFKGILDSVAIFANDMVATSDLHWLITLNSSALPGYEDATLFPGPVAYRSDGDSELGIDLAEEAEIAVTIRKVDVAVQRAGAALSGWYYQLNRMEGF